LLRSFQEIQLDFVEEAKDGAKERSRGRTVLGEEYRL
jgi:hypothetical protein